MKTKLHILLTFIVFFNIYTLFGQNQPKLIGLKVGSNNTFNLVSWTLGSTSFDLELPSVCSSSQYASSFFDSFSGDYFVRSTSCTANPNSLIKYNPSQNTINYLSNFTEYGMQETVVDMDNGNFYFFKVINGIRKLFVTNSSFNNITLLGDYPNVPTVLIKAIAFDSNNKIFYHIGNVGNQRCLIKTFVANNTFSYQALPITNMPAGGHMFIGYSNINNKLYTIYSTGSLNSQTIVTHIGELNTNNASYTNLFQVPQLALFHNLNVSFDQSSQSFVVVGSNYNSSAKLYWSSAINGQTTIYDLPLQIVYEMQCDNKEFATAFYEQLSNPTINDVKLNLFPNPTSDFLNVNINQDFDYEIFNLLGQIVNSGNKQNQNTQIDVSHLDKGIYTIVIKKDNMIYKNKFIKE